MNGAMVTPSPSMLNTTSRGGGGGGGGGARTLQPESVLNSARVGVVAQKIADYDRTCGNTFDCSYYSQLCISLARQLDSGFDWQYRGLDYGVAINDVPDQASTLPPILKQVCRRKDIFSVRAAIMVLMISVKNACKLGWFSAKDNEELLKLANEVGSYFGTNTLPNNEATSVLPTVSSIMARFYPQLKLGHIITALEVNPGYGTYAVDFHISKNISYSASEKIRLFVALKDNMDTSSCIINPQHVNLLLNGRAVDRRTNLFMDQGPQLPTIVNQLLKYGTNLLQAVGQFNGHYIILIAFMSIIPTSALPAPRDYVQPETVASSSGIDSEIIEGPSRIRLNCPISYRRIRIPVKGHLCKHYQCFDLNNFVEINAKRPSWRCPHCNQSVCFTDIRVDQNMVKILKEAGENVSEVIIHADGSWTAASSNNCKDDSQDKNPASQQEGPRPHDSSVCGQLSDVPSNVCDLTKDDEMDTVDRSEPVDMKPVINQSVQAQCFQTNATQPPTPRCTNDSPHLANGRSTGSSLYDYGAVSYNMRSEPYNVGGVFRAPTGNLGLSPVLTDAVSPALSQQPDNFHGTNFPTSSTALGQFAASNSLQLQEALLSTMSNDLNRTHMIPRNVTRTPSAIQALPVQLPSPTVQQHSRPAVGMPGTSGSSAPFQMPVQPNAHISSTVGSNMERQRHQQQASINPMIVSNMAMTSVQNRSTQVAGVPSPSPNLSRMPQTLSQPPHLARSSRGPIQQGVSPSMVGNRPSTVQPVQLNRPGAQMRQPQSMPMQTQSTRVASSLPLTTGTMPQAVTRTENLINLQSEQNWQPTGRMRGSLQGPAYSAALNQLMGQPNQPPQAPSPRPPVSAAPPLSSHLQALMSNRMNLNATQGQNQASNDGPPASGNAFTHSEQP